MRPLIIGEAPSKNEFPPTPIEGRIGRRLASYAGLSFEEFLTRFDRVNLLSVRQDTAEKGFTFDRVAALESWRIIARRIKPGQTVLLLGKRVADAVGCVNDYFEPCRLVGGITLYVVPHPSGVSRWWNDEKNKERMRGFMTELVKETACGCGWDGGLRKYCDAHNPRFPTDVKQ